MTNETIRLTETVQKGGCAAKLPAGELRSLLGRLNLKRSPELAVGTELMDDAALWDLGDGRYMVQTLDFFTPIVDSPRDFGAIAATNALSDVYAMGGEPKTAMCILAFPMAKLPTSVLEELMEGAVEKIHESGANLVGGHSIDDETLKFGLSVTGFVNKQKAWSNSGAQAGDSLILTKPLGTGTLSSAIKRKEAEPSWIDGAIQSMKTLNKVPELVGDFKIHAATDITGFGLGGHLLQVARASQKHIEIDLKSLPVLEGARECIERQILNKAHHSNLKYIQGAVKFHSDLEFHKWIVVDPQTSGGLVLCVPQRDEAAILAKLKTQFQSATKIGVFRDQRSEDGTIKMTFTT